MSPPRHPVVIVGASTAGLATAATLQHDGVPFVLLEKEEHVGHAWRHHYDRLHLHTNKQSSNLPFVPFGPDVPKYPSRRDVIDYLERYVETLSLRPRFGRAVLTLTPTDDVARPWRVGLAGSEPLLASAVVVATGYSRVPVRPSWPGLASFPGEVLHASEYRNGSPFRGRRVLVVGFGNSACEIAICLHEHGARPTLAVRGAVNILPRDVFGIPILSIGIATASLPPRLTDALTAPLMRALVGDFTRYGLRRLPYGPAEQIARDRRIPLLDIGTLSLIEEGIVQVRRGVSHVEGGEVIFDDGVREPFDAVILATGYRPGLERLLAEVPAALDERGMPRAPGGKSVVDDLYFAGFYVAPTGMIREAGREASRISRWIRARGRR